MNDNIIIAIDPFPKPVQFAPLWRAAWGDDWSGDLDAILARSLTHLGAFDAAQLIGFVNVAWDGGIHAFLLDTTVHPDYRRRGIASRLVKAATAEARKRGARWLHVDFEPQLLGFYEGCGFRPTAAGLIAL